MSVIDNATAAKEYKGINGWLVLVALGQVVGPVRLIASLYEYYNQPDIGASFQAFPMLVGIEALMNTGYVALMLACTICFFQKRSIFPKLFIWEVVLGPALILLDALMVMAMLPSTNLDKLIDAETAKDVGRSVGVAVIWIPYMLVSKRVKATFVN
ncbi:Protein of unknown function [Rhodospirillales bacterium URHD0017]|nr:Protein of unknown function [Rhodospirillales bacterium URHD0017]